MYYGSRWSISVHDGSYVLDTYDVLCIHAKVRIYGPVCLVQQA